MGKSRKGTGRGRGKGKPKKLHSEEEILACLETDDSQEECFENDGQAVTSSSVSSSNSPVGGIKTEMLANDPNDYQAGDVDDFASSIQIKDEFSRVIPTEDIVAADIGHTNQIVGFENGGPRLVLVNAYEPLNIVDDLLNLPSALSVSAVSTNGNLVPEIINLDEEEIMQPAKKRKYDIHGRGRALDSTWDEFCKPDTIEKTKVSCNHCGTAVSSKVERLKEHLKKCKNFKRAPTTDSIPSSILSFKAPTNVPTKSAKQQKVTKYVDVVTPEEKKTLDLEIGKYVFGANLPFSHTESRPFLKVMSILKPAYPPPSRKQIGSVILNEVDLEVMQKLREELRGKSVTMIQDGWKSSTDPIIAHCITTGSKSYFINAVNTGENLKTSEYCANLLLNSIEDVENRFDVNVFAAVTDNCNSMNRMREIIGMVKPDVFTYGCHAHLLNLVGKKLTSEDLQSKVEKVHKFFRNHDSAWALLKGLKGTRPVLASSIRWNSWIDCFQSYLKNQTKYLEVSRVAEAQMSLAHEIIEILNDGRIYNQVAETVAYLKPIQEALDALQSETAILADGVEKWINLQTRLKITDKDNENYFQKQFEAAVTDVGIASHMFHPKYRGNGLDSKLVERGNVFLSKTNGFLVILAAQLNQQNPDYFPKSLFSSNVLNCCSPVIWWKSQERMAKITPDVISFAVKLLSLPAGSADIERHFSVLGNIMNERRTRLGLEKAEKLCRIYKTLAGKEPPGDDGADWELAE